MTEEQIDARCFEVVKRAVEARDKHTSIIAPPRSGKTTAVEALIRQQPADAKVGYATYSRKLAENRVRNVFCRTACKILPLEVGDALTGHHFDLFIIDDPTRDRAEAESIMRTRHVERWIDYLKFERSEQILLIGCKMGKDDIFSQVRKYVTWKHVHIPAVEESGELNVIWDLEMLSIRASQLGLKDFLTIYMGYNI